jgi:hypothetical protein
MQAAERPAACLRNVLRVLSNGCSLATKVSSGSAAILRQDAHYERLGGVLKLPFDPDQKQSLACLVPGVSPTPQEVRCDLLLASKHIPKERLGSTDDCGFSPFSIDLKPKHGSPDLAREIAFKKIAARVEGTAMASEKLGLA